jgi:hypothetical protein
LANSGSAAVTISGITIGGSNTADFSQASDCPTSLSPGASCRINVGFKPADISVRTAYVAIADNGADSPQQIALSGSGQRTPPPAAPAGNTYHVFPQVADGAFSDGSYFQSTLLVTNINPGRSTNCTLQWHGLTVNGQTQISFTVTGLYSTTTPGKPRPLQTGYASLQCDAPVEAYVLYSFYAPNATKLSEATVFSSPPAITQRVAADYRGGSRLGLAVANTSTQAENYTLRVYDAGGSLIRSATLPVGAGQNKAAFLDELTTLPDGYYGFVDVAGSGSASVIGLQFTGTAFTTIPAVVIAP